MPFDESNTDFVKRLLIAFGQFLENRSPRRVRQRMKDSAQLGRILFWHVKSYATDWLHVKSRRAFHSIGASPLQFARLCKNFLDDVGFFHAGQSLVEALKLDAQALMVES